VSAVGRAVAGHGHGTDRRLFRAYFTPLNVAATVRLPALMAMVAALVLLRRGQRRPIDVALWSGLAGLAIDGIGQDIDHFRHVWVLIGLAAASMEIQESGPADQHA